MCDATNRVAAWLGGLVGRERVLKTGRRGRVVRMARYPSPNFSRIIGTAATIQRRDPHWFPHFRSVRFEIVDNWSMDSLLSEPIRSVSAQARRRSRRHTQRYSPCLLRQRAARMALRGIFDGAAVRTSGHRIRSENAFPLDERWAHRHHSLPWFREDRSVGRERAPPASGRDAPIFSRPTFSDPCDAQRVSGNRSSPLARRAGTSESAAGEHRNSSRGSRSLPCRRLNRFRVADVVDVLRGAHGRSHCLTAMRACFSVRVVGYSPRDARDR